MTLDELSVKYGSDKGSLKHNYMPFYEKHLPKEPKRILEIGVLNGASIKMWRDYFPNAEIHGLDLFSETDPLKIVNEVLSECSIQGILNNNVILHTGHQCDYLLLDELRKYDFDVIIDDGSHNSRDQLMTFFGLYNGKHYFIEDLHCNFEEFYSQGLPEEMRAIGLFAGIANFNSHFNLGGIKIDFNNNDIGINDHGIVCIKGGL